MARGETKEEMIERIRRGGAAGDGSNGVSESEASRLERENKRHPYGGVYGDVTHDELLQLVYGTPGSDRQAEVLERRMPQRYGTSYGGGSQYALRTVSGGEGRLTDAEIAELYVYNTRAPSAWRGKDGRMTNSMVERAKEMDEAVQTLLRIDPSLAQNPHVVWGIIHEPFLARRLQGMAKARDYVALRTEVEEISGTPDEHQERWWDDLTPARQMALRRAGYIPPQERLDPLDVRVAGMLGPDINRYAGNVVRFGQDVAQSTGLHHPIGAATWTLGTVLDLTMEGANEIGAMYRASSLLASEGKLPFTDPSYWWEVYHQAHDGDRFFQWEALSDARNIAGGDEERLVLYARLASGEPLEDIVGEFFELGSEEYTQAWLDLKRFSTQDDTLEAINRLQRGRISFGRDFARHILQLDDDAGGTEGYAFTMTSGAADAFWLSVTDPTFLLFGGTAGRGARGVKHLVQRDRIIALGQEADIQSRLHRLLGSMDGATLDAHVTSARASAGLTGDVDSPRYWSDLGKLDVAASQRPMVALADHMNAHLQGNTQALARFAQAQPDAREVFYSLDNYVRKVIPFNAANQPLEPITPGVVREFFGTAPGPKQVTPDDIMDFHRDESGLAALLSGYWSTTRQDRVLIPTLSKIGVRRIQAKLAMHDAVDWADQGVINLTKGMRWQAEDFVDPDAAATALVSAAESTANTQLADELQALKVALGNRGHDAETVTRNIERAIVRNGGIKMRPGEMTHEAIMRQIVTTMDENEAILLRHAWAESLQPYLGDDVFRHLDDAENAYRAGLGLTGDPMFDAQLLREHALSMATSVPASDVGIYRARYEQSLKNRGIYGPDLTDEMGDFDTQVFVLRGRRTHIDDADPALVDRLSRHLKIAVAKTAVAPARWMRSLAQQVPKHSVLPFHDPETPIILEQLLNFGVRGTQARHLYGEFLRSGEGGRKLVLRNVYRAMFDRMGILDDPDYAHFVKYWMDSVTRVYGVDDLMMTPAGMASLAWLPEAHMARYAAIPKFLEIDAQVKRNRFLKLLNGYGNKYVGIHSDAVDNAMSIWRTGVVLRPAMIPRAGGEELLSQYARHGLGYVIRQHVLARLVQVDPKVRRFAGSLNGRLYDDMASTVGLGADHRNVVHALADRIKADVSRLAEAALTPEQVHAYNMVATSRVVRSAFDNISANTAGLIPAARQAPEQTAKASRYAFNVVDRRTLEPVEIPLKPLHHWEVKELAETQTELYRQHLSGAWAELMADPTSRSMAAFANLHLADTEATRLGDLIGGEIPKLAGTPGLVGLDRSDEALSVVNRMRVAFAKLDADDRAGLIEWIEDGGKGLVRKQQKVLSDDGMDLVRSELGLHFSDFSQGQLKNLLNKLSPNDANALLAVVDDMGGIPVGIVDDLMAGPMYHGRALDIGDTDILFAGDRTFTDSTELMRTWGQGGPGLYTTSDGYVAEMVMRSDHGPKAAGSVVRLVPRKDRISTPLLNGADVGADASIMADQGRILTQDFLKRTLPDDRGNVLAYAYENRLDGPAARQVAESLGLSPADAAAIERIVGSRDWNDALQNLTVFPDLAGAARATRKGVSQISIRVTDEFRLPAKSDELIYNQLWDEHVVQHFGQRGYRGIELSTGTVSTQVYWHPGDLVPVGTTTIGDSFVADVVQDRAEAIRRTLVLSQVGAEDNRLEMIRRLMRHRYRQMLSTPEGQKKLARMEWMRNGVVQPTAPGMTRYQTVMVPDDVVRALVDAQRGGTDVMPELAEATGAAKTFTTAQMLAAQPSDPHTAQYLTDVMERFRAAEAHTGTVTGFPGRLVTTDPDLALQMRKRLRQYVEDILGPDAAARVHLGYVDISDLERAKLRSATSRGTGNDPTDIAAAEQFRRQTDGPGYQSPLESYDNPVAGVTMPLAPEAARPVLGVPGVDMHWMDDDMVLSRAVSYATDQPAKMLLDLDDSQRLALADVVTRLRESLPTMKGQKPYVMTAETDEELLLEMRTLLDDGLFMRTTVTPRSAHSAERDDIVQLLLMDDEALRLEAVAANVPVANRADTIVAIAKQGKVPPAATTQALAPSPQGKGLVVQVTGSRNWNDEDAIRAAFEKLKAENPDVIVVAGGARGADRLAAKVARDLNLRVIERPVNTAIDGPWPAAGHTRNTRMLDEAEQLAQQRDYDLRVLGFKENHRKDLGRGGTEHMLKMAADRNHNTFILDGGTWARPGGRRPKRVGGLAPKTTAYSVDTATTPFDTRIDRQTAWGNPYRIGPDGTREEVIAKYDEWVRTGKGGFLVDGVEDPTMVARAKWIRENVHTLRGQRLGCHCAPKACHGDVLAKMADEAAGMPSPEDVLRAVASLDDKTLPYVIEKWAPDALPKDKRPTGQWTMADGKTHLRALNELADHATEQMLKVLVNGNGEMMHGVVRPIASNTYRKATHLDNKDLGPLPEKVKGPMLTEDRGPNKAQQVANWGMEKIGQGIDVLARTPYFREAYADAVIDAHKTLRPMMVSKAAQAKAAAHVDDLPAAANRLHQTSAAADSAEAGYTLSDFDVIDILMEGDFYKGAPLRSFTHDAKGQIVEIRRSLTDQEAEIVAWWRQEHYMRLESDIIASTRAVKRIIPYIDDHRVRSQFAEKIRNIIPFWFAEEQFYKRWARTFVHSPEAFRRLTLAHNAFRSIGWLERNEYGEEVFQYPGGHYAAKAVAMAMDTVTRGQGWTLPIQAQFEGQLTYAAPGFDRIGIPTAGPLAGLTLRGLRMFIPDFVAEIEEGIMGERGVNRSLPEQVLPSTLYRLWKFSQGDEETLLSDIMGGIQMMEANHPDEVPPPDASDDDHDVYIERVRNYARGISLTRALMGFTAPASPMVNYDPEMLSQEYLSYLAAGVPPEIAVADFLRDHPEATPYTIFGTSTPSKAPADPTEEVYQALLDNRDFYKSHALGGAWLLPESAPSDPFDRYAWHEMLALKMRTRKDGLGFYRDLKFAQAASLYFASQRDKDAVLESTTDPNRRRAIRQSWARWRDDFLSGHRIFAAEYEGRGQQSESEREAVVNDLENALNDPRLPSVAHRPYLEDLLISYRNFQEAMISLTGDNRTPAVRTRAMLRMTFVDWAEDYTAQNETALLFWRRILLPQVDPERKYALPLIGRIDPEEEVAA